MSPADRSTFDDALLSARLTAFAPGEFVGQESFMSAREIEAVAALAGVTPGTSVLDLCCGVAGPGRLIAAQLGCTYLGVDADPAAIAIARRRAGSLPCRFEVGRIPPVPAGPFDVVLLLETMLAFPHKEPLLDAVAAALRPGGRLVFTVEEGYPLSPAEAERMPHADTVWLTPLAELLLCLDRAGLTVGWCEEVSAAHRVVAASLVEALTAERGAIAASIGSRVTRDLLTAHRMWCEWLGSGRVRKFVIVAAKGPTSGEEARDGSRT